MIDGIKIICISTRSKDWENNHLLSFTSKVDEQTGEIKSDTKIAYFKGLYFFLIPSTKSEHIHCIIKGSLAKYYNNGKDNAFDYNIEMLIETINDLNFKFSINPYKAIIQHFEYGCNIHTEKTPKSIIRGLRAYQSDSFTALKMDEVFTGKQIQKQEYKYKIYDKGLQIGSKDINLLRIELAIKSRKKAKIYGVEVLADLTKLTILEKVKPDLLKIWEDMIFYDYGMRWRGMDKKQKEKMLYYLDATNWEKFTRKQRSRAKNNFLKLYSTFCKSTTQKEILEQINIKIVELSASNGHALRFIKNKYSTVNMSRFTHLDKGVNRVHINNPKPTVKIKIEKRECMHCKKDISLMRKGSKFCSKQHNNAFHYQNKKKVKRVELYTTIPMRLNLTHLIRKSDKENQTKNFKSIRSLRGLAKLIENRYPDKVYIKHFHSQLSLMDRKGTKEIDIDLLKIFIEVLNVTPSELFKYPIHKQNAEKLLQCS